jgi:hypothetical protein
LWNFDEPFPSRLKEYTQIVRDKEGADKAEELQAWVNHDYIDKIWDDLPDAVRKYWEGFFMWVSLSPKILKEWAGVDVLKGRIHRIINDNEVWEDCPELKHEYKRLRSYIEIVKNNNEDLQNMLKYYGYREYMM